jgi:hypothetical protein
VKDSEMPTKPDHKKALEQLLFIVRQHAWACGTAVPLRVALREYDATLKELEETPSG